MASKPSIGGTLTIAANAIIEVVGLTIDEQGTLIEKPRACLDVAPVSTAGFGTAGGTIDLNLDLADTQHRALGVGTTGALVWRPEGAGTTKPEYTGTITLSSKKHEFSAAAYHKASYNFTGAVTVALQP